MSFVPATYTAYADYGDNGRVTQLTVVLPDTASYDQLGNVVRLLFRAGVLAEMDTQRDPSLASTQVMRAPAYNENTGHFSYLNDGR